MPIRSVISLVLAAVILVCVFTSCAKSDKAPVDSVTESTAVDTSVVSDESEQDWYISDETLTDYERLRRTLDIILEEKHFQEEVNLLFYDTLDNLYEYYPQWRKIYRDMPPTEEYIKNNFLVAAQMLDVVKFYDEDSPEGQAALEEEDAFGSMWAEDDKLYIHIIAKLAENADEDSRNNSIEYFYHELTHVRTEGIVCDPNDNFESYPDIRMDIIEGCSTFHMKFVTPFNNDVGGSWGIANADQSINIDYVKSNCNGYLLYLNVYEKLMYLAGYDTIYNMEMYNVHVDSISTAISGKYGDNAGYILLEKIGYRSMEYDDSWCGDEVYELSVEIENYFLSLIIKDIENCKSADELSEVESLYLAYKSRNMPVVYTESIETVITDEVFDTALVEKAIDLKKASFN